MVMTMSALGRWVEARSWRQLFAVGLVARLLLLAWGVVVQDAWLRVRYTDVDYVVFTDAARLVWEGGSAFDRATYRYTPLLAYLLLPTVWIPWAGKVLWVVCDLLCAAALASVCQRVGFSPRSCKTRVAAAWLLNPVVMNVSTRGNSEALTLALLLGSLALLLNNNSTRAPHAWVASALALGAAAHVRLFPVLHGVPVALFLWRSQGSLGAVVAYGVVAGGAAAALSVAAYLVDGQRYVHHALLYHAARADHRHSLSLAFPALYLAPGPAPLLALPQALASLVPSVALLVRAPSASAHLPERLCRSLALQTMIMVAFARVLTVQYFVWWLPYVALLPALSRSTLPRAVALWAAALWVWLACGYALEFEAAPWALHALAVAGSAFFLAQCNLIATLV